MPTDSNGITSAAEVFANLDAIITEMEHGYPDLVEMDPAYSVPASVRHRAKRIRECLEMILAECSDAGAAK